MARGSNKQKKKKKDEIINIDNEKDGEHENENKEEKKIKNSSKFLDQLLNIRMPKCSVCATTWFGDRDEPSTKFNFRKENLDTYIENKSWDFVPFPRCECTTTLVTNPMMGQLDEMFSKILKEMEEEEEDEEEGEKEGDQNQNKKRRSPRKRKSANSNHINDTGGKNTNKISNLKDSESDTSRKPTSGNKSKKGVKNKCKNKYSQKGDIMLDLILNQTNLSPNDIQSFPQKGMCKSCLRAFIDSANDVIEHDYRDENQPNIKYSTRKDCPCCRKKFSPKSLNALLNYNPSSSSSYSSSSLLYNQKKKGSKSSLVSWRDSIMYTIKFVRFSKRLKRALSVKELNTDHHKRKQNLAKKLSTNYNSSSASNRSNTSDEGNNGGESDSNIHADTYNEIHLIVDSSKDAISEWIEDEASSDDCFSCSDSDDNSDDDNNHHHKHIPLRHGELKAELLKKDPKFRQECEDLQYIQKMMKTEEGKKLILNVDESEIQEQLKQDEELARALQEEELNF